MQYKIDEKTNNTYTYTAVLCLTYKTFDLLGNLFRNADILKLDPVDISFQVITLSLGVDHIKQGLRAKPASHWSSHCFVSECRIGFFNFHRLATSSGGCGVR